MQLNSEVCKLCEKINDLHSEDPKVFTLWEELTVLLSADVNETLNFLSELEDSSVIENISSVFEDVALKLQSDKFIEIIEKLDNQHPELNLSYMVQAAKNNIY